MAEPVSCYSIDGEEYKFDEVIDVLDALNSEGRLTAGTVYHEHAVVPVDLAYYLRTDEIMERAEELLFDHIGDYADGAFSISNAAHVELEGMLKVWAAKHLTGRKTYYRFVGQPIERVVTVEDVADTIETSE